MLDSEEDTTLREDTRNDEGKGKKDGDPKTKGLAAEIAQQVLAALQSQLGSSRGKYLTPRSTVKLLSQLLCDGQGAQRGSQQAREPKHLLGNVAPVQASNMLGKGQVL